MKKLYALLTSISPLFLFGQYDFEKYPAINYQTYSQWKITETSENAVSSLNIPNFYKNGESLKLELTSSKKNWFENSIIKIYRNNQMEHNFHENMGFNPIAMDSVRVADINGDGLSDIKILVPYMGNGTAAMNVKVIYFFQQNNQRFIKVSFDDKQSENRSERDFNGDGNYEIITMQLISIENHSYWNFNLFNFSKGEIVNVNSQHDYPILVQFLEKENFKITNRIPRQKMKQFALKRPENCSIEK